MSDRGIEVINQLIETGEKLAKKEKVTETEYAHWYFNCNFVVKGFYVSKKELNVIMTEFNEQFSMANNNMKIKMIIGLLLSLKDRKEKKL